MLVKVLKMKQRTKIFFLSNQIFLPLKERKKLKIFLLSVFKKNKKSLESISFIFCTDEFLLDINQRFLNHDFYTDVITFNLSKNKSQIEAEVYISIDRVKENAIIEKTTQQTELHRVIFHGVLHLCGYDDKEKPAKIFMRKMENKLLNQYFKNSVSRENG